MHVSSKIMNGLGLPSFMPELSDTGNTNVLAWLIWSGVIITSNHIFMEENSNPSYSDSGVAIFLMLVYKKFLQWKKI